MTHIENFSLAQTSTSPGVYIMKDAHERILYIGKAKNLRKRLASYFKHHDSEIPSRIHFLMEKVRFIETILVTTETEALLLENNLIKQHHPKYNILLKDDKTFFCLAISLSHPWPRITMIRTKHLVSSEKQLVFGPYVHSEACKTLLEIISQSFPLRTCSNREFASRQRPCVLYDMKRCLAPCVGLCSQEEYQQMIDKVVLFLRGDVQEVIQGLEASIHKASQEKKFEQAATYHRMLLMIEKAMEKQHVETLHASNIDAIGLYRKDTEAVITLLTVRSGKLLGAKNFPFSEVVQDDEDLISEFILQYYEHQQQIPKTIFVPVSVQHQALAQALRMEKAPRIQHPKHGYGRELITLANNNARDHSHKGESWVPYQAMHTILNISPEPSRIECYDNAHLQGDHGVGGFIVFEKEMFVRKEYRHFHIHTHANDLASFDEVLTKRFRMSSLPLPDCIVIDGGQAQFSFVQRKIHEEFQLPGIHIVAIAKDHGNHSRTLNHEKLFCAAHPRGLQLPPTSKLLQFFQRLRDEAHTFVIKQHRKKHISTLFSFSEKIPGIGTVKQQRLLQTFKSWQRALSATQEELEQVKGLTKKDILAILHHQKQRAEESPYDNEML